MAIKSVEKSCYAGYNMDFSWLRSITHLRLRDFTIGGKIPKT